eukprot:ANDGO_04783.mRNA.1 3-hydroxyanthranilate 3
MSNLLPPLNLFKWIEEHRAELKPPVGNKMIYNEGEFRVMVVGGPNSRTDYHVEVGPEWFFQIQGDIVVRIIDPDTKRPRDIAIKEGEMFLLPPFVPHSPQRTEGSVGLVIERERKRDEPLDIMRWYCDRCFETVYEASLYADDLSVQLKPVIEQYRSDPSMRTCKSCGHVNEK